MPLSDEHLAELSEAKRLLENPGLAVKITNLIGKPIEKGFELLPDSWSQRIGVATKDALMFAMNGALLTMDRRSGESYPRWHKVAAALSGAAGGAFGLPALLVELLVSTTIASRSIAYRRLRACERRVARQWIHSFDVAGGAVINLLSIDHFQDMSRGHFTVRRLERQYGTEAVRRVYERI